MTTYLSFEVVRVDVNVRDEVVEHKLCGISHTLSKRLRASRRVRHATHALDAARVRECNWGELLDDGTLEQDLAATAGGRTTLEDFERRSRGHVACGICYTHAKLFQQLDSDSSDDICAEVRVHVGDATGETNRHLLLGKRSKQEQWFQIVAHATSRGALVLETITTEQNTRGEFDACTCFINLELCAVCDAVHETQKAQLIVWKGGEEKREGREELVSQQIKGQYIMLRLGFSNRKLSF